MIMQNFSALVTSTMLSQQLLLLEHSVQRNRYDGQCGDREQNSKARFIVMRVPTVNGDGGTWVDNDQTSNIKNSIIYIMVKRASWRALGALWCHLSGFSRYKNAKRSVFDRKALVIGTCARPLTHTQNSGERYEMTQLRLPTLHSGWAIFSRNLNFDLNGFPIFEMLRCLNANLNLSTNGAKNWKDHSKLDQHLNPC